MWTCSLLKHNAKQALYGRYWRCFGACLLLGFLGVSSNAGANLWGLFALFDGTQGYLAYDDFGSGAYADRFLGGGVLHPAAYQVPHTGALDPMPVLAAVFVGVFLVVFALVFCWIAFLSLPLTVGRARYFMESRQAPAPVSTLFSVFDSGYLNIVKVHLLVRLKILAGSLIVIPGIYWSYCYYLVPYLLAENPYLTTRRAMQLSRQMMEGEKWHTFVLEFSFIGWNLLAGLLPFGLGGLFLNPYYQATFAELYAALRSKAFAYGISNGNELGGFVTRDLSANG